MRWLALRGCPIAVALRAVLSEGARRSLRKGKGQF